jgi:hypothetical protein
MYDLAHACLTCRTVTIFHAEAPYPRRCGRCDEVVRHAPSTVPTFLDEDAENDERFVLELRPETMDAAPF